MTAIFDSLHRVITLDGAVDSVAARITDNVHDFGVAVRHDGQAVTAIEGFAYRVPWTTCPAATARLAELVGTPLRRDGASGARIDKSQQCTHLFDLAKLAIAFAPQIGRRRYDVRVDTAADDGAVARLDIDGQPVLCWMIDANRVVSHGPFAGHVTTGAAVWPPDAPNTAPLIEAAMLLRRALLVFYGRRRTEFRREAAALPHMAGACFSFQPERMAVAVRPEGFVELPSETVAELPWPPRRSPL